MAGAVKLEVGFSEFTIAFVNTFIMSSPRELFVILHALPYTFCLLCMLSCATSTNEHPFFHVELGACHNLNLHG